jgi:hypothetical protein
VTVPRQERITGAMSPNLMATFVLFTSLGAILLVLFAHLFFPCPVTRFTAAITMLLVYAVRVLASRHLLLRCRAIRTICSARVWC